MSPQTHGVFWTVYNGISIDIKLVWKLKSATLEVSFIQKLFVPHNITYMRFLATFA